MIVRISITALILAFVPAVSLAGPVIVELRAQASTRTSVVTIGDVATVTGGEEAERNRIAQLDLAEFKLRDPNLILARRLVAIRLDLAGIDPSGFKITGADSIVVMPLRRRLTAEEVVEAAKAELLRRLPMSPESVSVTVIRPPAVELPEVSIGDNIGIDSKLHTQSANLGRVQMDVMLSSGGNQLLGLAVVFEVKPVAQQSTTPPQQAATAVVPVNGAIPAMPAKSNDFTIKPRQRVTIMVKAGALYVSAVGEAQQEGKMGQSILVQNIDSKKVLSARVIGPTTVEVEMGGVP